jgi:hypothetical protein
MKSPANWLIGECYDEDLPEAYADPKDAAIAKARDRGPATRTKTTEVGKHGNNLPRGVAVMTVKAAGELGNPFDKMAVKLTLTDGAGAEYEYTFWPCHTDDALAEIGMRHLREICHALTNGIQSECTA